MAIAALRLIVAPSSQSCRGNANTGNTLAAVIIDLALSQSPPFHVDKSWIDDIKLADAAREITIVKLTSVCQPNAKISLGRF
jgi:hypothetical protein